MDLFLVLVQVLVLVGATVLILLLNIFIGLDQHIAQSTNLICFIPSAIVATISNFKKKLINIKNSISILIFGIIGSAIGSIISINIDVFYLKKLFGIFLLIIAFFEITSFYKTYMSLNIFKSKENSKFKN